MDLELKEISLTIVTGVAMASSVVLAVRLSGHPDWKIILPHLFEQEGEGLRIFRAFVILAVVFGVGVFIEDMAKNAVAHRSPTIPFIPIDLLLPPERVSRVASLVDEDTIEVVSRKCTDTLSKSTTPDEAKDKTALDFGSAGRGRLSELGMRLYIDMKEVKPSQGGLEGAFLSLSRFAIGDKAISCLDAWELQEIYYRSKNLVYAEDNYFVELQELYSRLGFVRSMLFVAIAAALEVLIATIIRFVRLARKQSLSDGSADSLSRANRAVCGTLLIVGIAIVVAKSTYMSEERNYNNRVYGYFDTIVFEDRKADTPKAAMSSDPARN